MADIPSSEELFALWRKQIEAGTDAWAKTVSQMAGQGQAPSAPPDPAMFWRPFMDQGVAGWAQLFSAGPVSPELMGQWKKFLDDWIAAWTRALEQAMGTEAFAQALGKTLDQFLTVQGAAKQTLEQSSQATLQSLGLPSRDQVVGLSRQLMDLEDRIEAIEDALGRARPPRCHRPETARETAKKAVKKIAKKKDSRRRRRRPRSRRRRPRRRPRAVGGGRPADEGTTDRPAGGGGRGRADPGGVAR